MLESRNTGDIIQHAITSFKSSLSLRLSSPHTIACADARGCPGPTPCSDEPHHPTNNCLSILIFCLDTHFRYRCQVDGQGRSDSSLLSLVRHWSTTSSRILCKRCCIEENNKARLISFSSYQFFKFIRKWEYSLSRVVIEHEYTFRCLPLDICCCSSM